jgi:hypothetical protein
MNRMAFLSVLISASPEVGHTDVMPRVAEADKIAAKVRRAAKGVAFLGDF